MHLVLAQLAYGGGAREGVSEEVPLLGGAVVQPRGHIREDGADPLVNHSHLDVTCMHTYIHTSFNTQLLVPGCSYINTYMHTHTHV